MSASSLVVRYVDEGVRADLHPGVVFREGPGGRRAGLAAGPDVWEIASLIKHLGAKGERAIRQAAKASGLSLEKIRSAVAYWADFPEEIEEWVSAAERDSLQAERHFEAEQRVLG